MRVLLSVAVWGRRYAAAFADISLASQLSSNNIPRIAREHSVSYLIVTTKRDKKWLERHANVRLLGRHVEIDWDYVENYKYAAGHLPGRADGEKYPFLSRLQNLAIEASLSHDILIFNYADFVWSNGSLGKIVELASADVDAILGFCLPIDWKKGERALRKYRMKQGSTVLLDLSARDAAVLAMENLHREALIRMWDGDEFSTGPTYLIWRVRDRGLIVRAYHQTVLALTVKKDDPRYRAGIRYGSLDGYFTGLLAEHGKVRHLSDSDDGLVFSLYHANVDTALERGRSRDDAMQECLLTSVSEGQRRFAEVPIYVKVGDIDANEWTKNAAASLQILQRYHQTIPADPEAFEKTYLKFGDIATLESRWLSGARTHVPLLHARKWFYREVLTRLMIGPAGRLAKGVLGRGRARQYRQRIERWLFGE